MKDKSYINYNGKLYSSEERIFTINNRAFKYGDALFETFRVINGKLCFVDDHFERLLQGEELLKMKPCNISSDEILSQIEELLIKNKITKGVRVRLTVFRDADGFYQPSNEKKAYVIEAKSIDNIPENANRNAINYRHVTNPNT